jgi:hypothetical protein
VAAFYRGLLIIGVLMIILGGVIVISDSDDLSARMPTQVVPRRFARHLLVVGGIVLAVAIIGAVFA